ncbi:hypothetical protein ACPCG0_01930 [Propionibacteriaceae bacterium Y1923]|uniref:hypothetical protein n=1 Tax=Aestuariimicrobium sp. Y1814 TaxID=3418742 RepID=UPI003C17BBB4
MARRSNKHLRTGRDYQAPRPLNGGHATSAHKAGQRWIVRTIPAAAATKTYTCPECLHPVLVGVAHIVAWPDTPSFEYDRAVDARRHWHTACWNRKP